MSAAVDLQRTEQWHQDRSGRLTASRFKDVIAWGIVTSTESANHLLPAPHICANWHLNGWLTGRNIRSVASR